MDLDLQGREVRAIIMIPGGQPLTIERCLIVSWEPEVNLTLLQQITQGPSGPVASEWHLVPASQVIYSGVGQAPIPKSPT